MAKSRIRTYFHSEEPTPARYFTDYDWIRTRHNQLLTEYGEKYLIVYNEQIIGIGETKERALMEAETNLPAEVTEAIPVVYKLYNRDYALFSRVRLHITQDSD